MSIVIAFLFHSKFSFLLLNGKGERGGIESDNKKVKKKFKYLGTVAYITNNFAQLEMAMFIDNVKRSFKIVYFINTTKLHSEKAYFLLREISFPKLIGN